MLFGHFVFLSDPLAYSPYSSSLKIDEWSSGEWSEADEVYFCASTGTAEQKDQEESSSRRLQSESDDDMGFSLYAEPIMFEINPTPSKFIGI